MNKIKPLNIYAADYETDRNAKIWLWGLSKLGESEIEYGISAQTFYERLETIEDGAIIYFHNGGRFDTYYTLQDILFSNGFLPVTHVSKDENRKEFKYCGVDYVFYQVEVFWGKKKIFFVDSYRIIPKSIKDLGGKQQAKMDYYSVRNYTDKSQVPENDIIYLKEDISTMKKYLLSELFYGDTNRKNKVNLTIGSYVKNVHKMDYFIRYNTYNKLSVEEWDFMKKGYRGGLCFCNPKYLKKAFENTIFRKYDVNSFYPSIMRDEELPYGEPFGHRFEPDMLGFHYIKIEKLTIKPNKHPFIQVKDDKGIYDFIYTAENFEFHCWDNELETIKETYDVVGLKIKKSLFFRKKQYMKHFVETYYNKRLEYRQKNDAVNAEICKAILNNAYGKYGQNRERSENVFIKLQPGELEKVRANSRIFTDSTGEKWYLTTKNVIETDVFKLSYIPLASYITACCRVKIHKLWNEHYDTFVYCDTDSIILHDDFLDEKYVCDTTLGKLKLESESSNWYCYNTKKYWFRDIIKFGGATIENKYSFDEFCNLTRIVDGKKTIEWVDGKPLIKSVDYCIN